MQELKLKTNKKPNEVRYSIYLLMKNVNNTFNTLFNIYFFFYYELKFIKIHEII